MVGTAFSRDFAGVFSAGELIGMGGYWLAGLWVPAVTHYYLVCLPVLLPAVWLGRVVNHRLHGDAFLKYVYVGWRELAWCCWRSQCTDRVRE